SREADALIEQAQVAVADLVGCAEPREIVFGANMTTLTFALSRAIGRTWAPGDEVIVSRLDHDANYTPWVLAAREAGARLLEIPLQLPWGTLDFERYLELLSNRTRLVAVGLASNITGTINPVAEMAHLARGVGALTFVDAVHYAPHRLIDVDALGC